MSVFFTRVAAAAHVLFISRASQMSQARSCSPNFVASSAEIDVQCMSSGRSKITFQNPEALTVRTDYPFVRGLSGGLNSFNVLLLKKPSRTAIGLSFCQNSEHCYKYMTPAHISGDMYISFGGAGFIYPSQARASRGYAEGDSVRVLCDFAKNIILFFVNGASVAVVPLNSEVRCVYPSISCERGVTVVETWFE
jgi:hypothetical protein